MKKLSALGNPMCVTFTCRHLVAGTLTVFDPSVVICSWLKPSGAEDAQTYGGTAIGDSLLTRISTGIYQAIYVSTEVGEWKVSPYWRDTVGGVTYSFRPVTPGYFIVEPVPFTFADVPPATP